MNFLTFLRRKILIWNSRNTTRLSLPTISIKKDNGGVLIERAHYYTILEEGVSTIREWRTNRGGRSNLGSTVIHFQSLFNVNRDIKLIQDCSTENSTYFVEVLPFSTKKCYGK